MSVAVPPHALDAVIGQGSAVAVAEVIDARPEAEREDLLARVHRERGNRFALDVEVGLLRRQDRDPVAPIHEGQFNLSAAETRLVIPSREGSREVLEMLTQSPDQIGAALAAFDRDGLLHRFLEPLPFAEVEMLADYLYRQPGHSRVLAVMRPYYEGRDKSDNSITGLSKHIPVVGKVIPFAFDGLTFGFVHEHDQAYKAKKEGLLTEDEYVERSNHASLRAAAVAAGSIALGGAATSYMAGLTSKLATWGAGGELASTVATGAVGGGGAGFGAQLGSDVVDGDLASPGQYAHSVGVGAAFGVATMGAGTVIDDTLTVVSPATRTKLAALAKRFPHDNELFAQFREAGEQHVLTLEAARLDTLLGEGAARWRNRDLAMAMAGLPPDAPVRITAELTDDGITVIHAEKLPDAKAFGEKLAAGEGRAGATPREQRLYELAQDAALNGKVTAKTLREAEVALGLEEAGVLPGPVRRVQRGDGHSGDYYDGDGVDWDVKAPHSREVILERLRAKALANGEPPPRPGKASVGEFELDDMMADIVEEIRGGENVIIDTQNLTAADHAALRKAITGSHLESRVRWYPP